MHAALRWQMHVLIFRRACCLQLATELLLAAKDEEIEQLQQRVQGQGQGTRDKGQGTRDKG